jgi:hypothetical protein
MILSQGKCEDSFVKASFGNCFHLKKQTNKQKKPIPDH